jgi:hypothetical protein
MLPAVDEVVETHHRSGRSFTATGVSSFGFEWAINHPGRVLSLTVLDTVVDVAAFRPPWPM